MKMLQDRSHDLERQRTRALATGKWPRAIELDARLDEVGLIQSKVLEHLKEVVREAADTTQAQAIETGR